MVTERNTLILDTPTLELRIKLMELFYYPTEMLVKHFKFPSTPDSRKEPAYTDGMNSYRITLAPPSKKLKKSAFSHLIRKKLPTPQLKSHPIRSKSE